jgi:hypothetical protein
MRIGLWLFALYAIVCVLALSAIPLSAAGRITPDPLSAVPAILLGLPWSYLLLRFGDPQSVPLNLSLMALSMAINAAILWLLVRVANLRSQRKGYKRPG